MCKVTSQAIKLILQSVNNCGFATDQLLTQLTIDKVKLYTPDGRIPLNDHNAVYDKLITLTGDHFLGLHAGEKLTLKKLGLLSYIISTSSNIEQALLSSVRYSRLLDNFLICNLAIDDHHATYSIGYNESEVQQHWQDSDFILAITVTILRKILRDSIKINEIRFAHGKPDNEEEYREFFDCNLSYNSKFNEVILDSTLLNTTLINSDSYLHQILSHHAESVISDLPKLNDMAEKTKRYIIERLSQGLPSVEQVASRFKLTPRTLHRRLNDQGITYRSLLNDARKELATQYLATSQLSIGEIGYLLGYSEASAFQRAFKCWFGVTPTVYRNLLR